MKRGILSFVCSLIVLCSVVSLTYAVNISGVVKDSSGNPLPGVMVTADNIERKIAKTVITDEAGSYVVPDLFPGKYVIRAQRTGYQTSETKDFSLMQKDAKGVNFSLGVQKDISEQMPASAWLSRIPDSDQKLDFIKGCTICHQFGDKATRLGLDKAGWLAEIKKMRGMDIYSVIPKFDDDSMAEMLAKYFGPTSPAPNFQPPPPTTGEAAQVVITEYWLPKGAWAHDITVGNNGYVWAVDYLRDKLIRLNPLNGEIKEYDIPVKGTGAHTIHPDRDGNLWLTLQLADMIAKFDPTTEKFRLYGGLSKGSLVHSFAYDTRGYVAFDKGGHLWVTYLGLNKLAKLHPDTGKVTEYDTPLRSEKPAYAGMYGIAMGPDGNIWYGKYEEDTFGKIDPETGKVTQYDMPKKGVAVHRLGVDDHGIVWIPESASGRLVRYDPQTKKFKYYDLPDKDAFPYAIRIDGTKDIIWITGTGSDSMYKFDPSTEKFVKYPLPSRVAFTRMAPIDYSTGDVWTSYSNFPGPAVVVRLQFTE
jgi:streptogramin lyase